MDTDNGNGWPRIARMSTNTTATAFSRKGRNEGAKKNRNGSHAKAQRRTGNCMWNHTWKRMNTDNGGARNENGHRSARSYLQAKAFVADSPHHRNTCYSIPYTK
jgi:hypothetical protein